MWARSVLRFLRVCSNAHTLRLNSVGGTLALDEMCAPRAAEVARGGYFDGEEGKGFRSEAWRGIGRLTHLTASAAVSAWLRRYRLRGTTAVPSLSGDSRRFDGAH